MSNCKLCRADCVRRGEDRQKGSCKGYIPMTNADRIRAMSDEELAKFIADPCQCEVEPERDGYRECGNDLCIKYLLNWLQQPAEKEDTNG